MSTLKTTLENNWWRSMYNRNLYGDPANVAYGRFANSGRYTPMTIGRTEDLSFILSRNCSETCSYDVGGINRYGAKVHKQVDMCSDVTGNPYQCAIGYGALGRIGKSDLYRAL